jgi:hypothetical protein
LKQSRAVDPRQRAVSRALACEHQQRPVEPRATADDAEVAVVETLRGRPLLTIRRVETASSTSRRCPRSASIATR